MKNKWISVHDKLPGNGVDVIAYYKNVHGYSVQIIGHYMRRWTEESNCDECNDEYSEELDGYFLIEGWYERVNNWDDYDSITVHEGDVTHWMPLPMPPNEDEA